MLIPDRTENRGASFAYRRFNRSALAYSVRNLNSIKAKIVTGNEVRFYVHCISVSNLKSYWHLEDVNDDGPGKHHFTQNGGSFVTNGKDGKGWSPGSDGDLDYLETAHHADFNGGTSGAHAVVFWLYLNSAPAATRAIFCKGTNSSQDERAPLIFIDSSRLLGYRKSIGGGSVHSCNGLTAVPLQTWVRIVCQFDGTIGMQIYQNGTLDKAQAGNTTAMAANSSAMRVGKTSGTLGITNGATCDMIIDDLTWYNRTLTTAEITTDATSEIAYERVFTGVNTDYDETGTFGDTIVVTCRDLFEDLKLSEDINKRYADQEIATTVTDVISIVNTERSAGLTTTGISTLTISQPYNFVSENLERVCSRITKSTFSELFMRPTKEIVLRSLRTVNSGITITDTQIRKPESISHRHGISNSYGLVRVVGGLSTEAYDLAKRIIAEARIPNAATNIAKRVYDIVDERFTTFKGAKTHALTVADEVGSEAFVFDSPFSVQDLTKLPVPGELLTLNSTELAINQSFIVEEYHLNVAVGEDSTKFIEIKLGNSEQSEVDTLVLLRSVYEDEKRKLLDADADTEQQFFSVACKHTHALTITVTPVDPVANPYIWGDGDGTRSGNEFNWAFWSWGDG